MNLSMTRLFRSIIRYRRNSKTRAPRNQFSLTASSLGSLEARTVMSASAFGQLYGPIEAGSARAGQDRVIRPIKAPGGVKHPFDPRDNGSKFRLAVNAADDRNTVAARPNNNLSGFGWAVNTADDPNTVAATPGYGSPTTRPPFFRRR